KLIKQKIDYKRKEIQQKEKNKIEENDKTNIEPNIKHIKKKMEILNKLRSLVQNGTKLSKNFNLESDYDEMFFEFEFHTNPQFRSQILNDTKNQNIIENPLEGTEKVNKQTPSGTECLQSGTLLNQIQHLQKNQENNQSTNQSTKKQEQIRQLQELSLINQKMQMQNLYKLQQLKQIQRIKEQQEKNDEKNDKG